MPLEVGSLLRPQVVSKNGFVGPSPSLDAFASAIIDRIRDFQNYESSARRPFVFGFGYYERWEKDWIDRTTVNGGNPFAKREDKSSKLDATPRKSGRGEIK